ncbi:sigma-70 family RNA polymerase sigma factor [Chitinophaga sp. MM2321]|uniref:sigma-70 family RNA polymerase sigma factor n=1 Tax=Chitinophaga sp. MM2321 TaxID=3137178 RepID=UPI0032D56E27
MNTVIAIRQGDRVIFETVFQEYYEKLYLYVLHKTNSRYIAEECTQLTFIKLWQYRASLSEELSISIQLFRIARTTMIDQLRKKTTVALPIYDISAGDEIWGGLHEKELNSQLVQVLQKMPPVRKKVFEMSRFKGMSAREIAAELSISVKAVEYHITQAIKYLRNHIALLPLWICLYF